MRVLMATHCWLPHFGGLEIEAREQAKGIVARGHDVVAITSQITDPRPLSHDDGFPLHRVPANNFAEERLHLPYPLFSPRLFGLMTRLARDSDVVVAHTHLFMSTVAAAYAARRAHKPFVLIQNNPWIEYGFVLDKVERIADATIGRYTVASADQLIAISHFTGKYLERMARDKPVTVMHLGTDTARFSPVDRRERADIRRRLGLDPDAFVALTVRRLIYRNGLDTLLDAAARLQDRSRLQIVIGGAGPGRGEIEQRIRRDRLENVHLAGFIPDADLPDYYRAADVFVLPTRTAEGFGLVLMEAAATGIPSVATDSGAPREIVDDGATGLIVPAAAPDALAAALVTLFDSPELTTTFGNAALAKSASFTWDRSIDVLERILLDTVERSRSRP